MANVQQLTGIAGDYNIFQLTTATATEYAVYRGAYLIFTLLAIGTLQRPVHGLKYFRMWAGCPPMLSHYNPLISNCSSEGGWSARLGGFINSEARGTRAQACKDRTWRKVVRFVVML